LPSSYGAEAKSEVTIIPNGKSQCAALDARLAAGLASNVAWLDGLMTPDAEVGSANPSWLAAAELGSTSFNMSYYMLDTYNTNRKNRWGAFVCDDKIPTDVTVDWGAVNDLIPAILTSLASAPAATLAVELALVANSPYSVGPAVVPVASVQAACEAFVTDSSSALFVPCAVIDLLAFDLEGGVTADDVAAAVLNVTSTGGGGGLIAALLDTLNSTAAFDREAALAALLSASGLFPNGTLALVTSNGTTVSLPRAELGVKGVDVADDGSSVAFTGVTVALGDNTTLAVGNVTLTVAQLQDVVEALFGNGIELYTFATQTSLTVAHNASSWHALWLFQGLARQERYRDHCLDPAVWSDDATAADDVAERFADDDARAAGRRRSPGRFVVRNHPLPLTTRQTLEVRAILSVFASLFVLIALSYAPAAFVTFVVKERQCKSLHLQKVSTAMATPGVKFALSCF
jgi:hypothetical protein